MLNKLLVILYKKAVRCILLMKKNWPIVAGSIFLGVIIIFYFAVFHSGLSNNDINWANFGSYIGGSAGSVFSFITLVYVVKSFNQQKEEKEKSQEEREQEKLQVMFFKSLDLLNNCINNLSYNNIHGNDLISTYIKNIDRIIYYYPTFTDEANDAATFVLLSKSIVQPFIQISQYIIELIHQSKNFMAYKALFCSLLSHDGKVILIYLEIVQSDFFIGYLTDVELKYLPKNTKKFAAYKQKGFPPA